MEDFNQYIFIGAFGGTIAFLLVTYFVIRRASVILEPEESALLLAFGRCIEQLNEPGYHFRPALWIPGYRVIRVTRRLDHQLIRDVHVNDAAGTTLRLDVWMDFKVTDAHKSVFAVEDWHEAMTQLVPHAMMNQAGKVRLENLLADRESVALAVLQEIREDSSQWGISVESLYIQDVRVLSEISRQLFNRVAAQIEMKKARIEEQGRIDVQTLEAETEVRVSKLQAQAKSVHPLAVSRAYATMDKKEGVLTGFQELHHLSLLPPGRVISFVGFGKGEVRALDTMMIPADGGTNVSIERTKPH